jgi:hypothetical protein
MNLRTTRIFIMVTGILLASAASPASAHASLQLYGERAVAGGRGVVFVRIPHGCTGGLPTDTVVVSIPPTFASVRPQHVGGWTASRTATGSVVSEVRWVGGPLLNSEFADFGISVRYPTTPGTYGLRVEQICGSVRTVWDGADLPTIQVLAPGTPRDAEVSFDAHRSTARVAFDGSAILAGERVRLEFSTDGRVVRRMSATLDERGDLFVSIPKKGSTPRGTRYELRAGSTVSVIHGGSVIGSATLTGESGAAGH